MVSEFTNLGSMVSANGGRVAELKQIWGRSKNYGGESVEKRRNDN